MPRPAPPPAPAPEPPAAAPSAAPSVYYPNCAAARAAGVAPILLGEAGYRPGLDRDKDGVACEE
ncbi:excalibur calcium-binding domain-containing protein [Nocardia sp. NPDC057455]|uniref:excalibur calcium-binding domain-containing protein n=1 Tax=Nocardia sp. NPDC057455 TaxID=3346138 RepID=UPI00366CA2AE